MSSFTWLDYSEHDRRRMLDIVDLFREQDTRDELGLGSIRDAFADKFFPGTSTIMTRAKYFLLVPWTYLRLEERKVTSLEIAASARKAELDLVEVIARSDDKDGNIGKVAKRALKRLPSSVYWQGLGVWGIRSFSGAQAQYHRSLDRYYEKRKLHGNRSTERDGEHDEVVTPNWHGGLPKRPKDYPDKMSLGLSRLDAEYLRDRIRLSPGCSGSLLAELVARRHKCEPISFAWEHPLVGDVPLKIRNDLDHARNFSEVMFGAVLLYNLILAEQTKRADGVSGFRRSFAEWADMITEREGIFARWDRPAFWSAVQQSNPGIPESAQKFVDAWCDLAIPAGRKRLRDSGPARDLIRLRERKLKKNLARIDNPQSQHLWSGSSGTAQLDFRWGIAQRILNDVIDGLEGSDA